MGKIKLFPTAEYSKTALGPRGAPGTMHRYLPWPQQVRQNRGADQHIFSPSINIDDGWIPVKKYIEEDLRVNTERERAYYDEWDEAALRDIIQRQRKITETSKKLEMKKLYQVLIICDDFADSPQLHKPHGALDTLFIRSAPANKHLGELPEAEAYQRSSAGNFSAAGGCATSTSWTPSSKS